MHSPTYPSQKDNTTSLPQALRASPHIDATGAGYLQASVFGLILLLPAMLYGAATGSRAVAGEEESAQLVLAHPLTRTRLVLQRFAAPATGAGAISVLVRLALPTIRDCAELTSVTPGELLAQRVKLAGLGIVFGALALGPGAASGRRGVVLAGTAAIGILACTAHTFAAQIGADQFAYLSPFQHSIGGQPLRNGFQWVDIDIVILSATCEHPCRPGRVAIRAPRHQT